MSLPEKRMRIRSHEDVTSENSKMNSKMAEQLGISEEVEAIVSGKWKGKWKVDLTESVPANEVWMNGDELKAKGIADNTIATIRKPRGEPKP
jgi:ATP-dependent protease ClpP protease subunit